MPKKRSQTTSFDASFECITTHYRDTIRRSCSSSDDEDRIPTGIQIFLWRQSKPFIKRNFGNLTDASAIVFDQVLAQNILHGLSPSLTDAISSIPRWLLFKAAFPHVMHACSSIIEHKLDSTHSLSRSQIPLNSSINNQIELRLFHTLHYLILYSNENINQLLSLNTIQLFIYLFIPYIYTYLRNNEKDFLSNSDLAEGMRLIWQPLFEYHQPNIRIFNTFVKPVSLANDQEKQRFYIENNNQHHGLSILIESPIQNITTDKQPLSDLTNIKFRKELKSTAFIITDSDSITTAHDSATDLEGYDIANNNKNTKIRAPIVHMNSICSVSDLGRLTITSQSPVADKSNIIPRTSSSLSTPSIPCFPQVQNTCSIDTPPLSKPHSSEYLLLATYFDIGIIRTLFSPSWLTDGYIWCLEYLNKRIIDISDEILSDNNISSNNFKSLSISQLNNLNNQNYFNEKNNK